jgi:hypothetical protein
VAEALNGSSPKKDEKSLRPHPAGCGDDRLRADQQPADLGEHRGRHGDGACGSYSDRLLRRLLRLIGLGAANIIGAGSGDPLNVDFYRIESSSFNFLFDWEEKRLAQGGNNIFSWTSTNASFAVPVTFATNVTVNGNATLNGVDNLAPSQTASSGSSLMTRDLSDDRYSFSRWYDANNLLSGAQAVGVNPLSTGNGSGHVANAILVTVSNVNTKFMLPVDYRVSGEVKVVSYWTDRAMKLLLQQPANPLRQERRLRHHHRHPA